MNNTCPGETAQSRTVAKLKHRLQSGQFTNVMPGERELSKALAAGRETIRKALAQLQEEGFLAAPDKNRARKIIRTSTSPVQSLPLLEKRVCFLSSVPIRDIPQSIWVELYQLEKALREKGIALQLVEAAWEEKNNPGTRLEKLETEYPGCCWILYRATEEIQLWFKRKGLPCLVRGVSYPSSNLPYLDTHWEVLASHAAGYLYQKGHRRIALCIPDSKLRGNKLMEQGFLSFQGEHWTPCVIRMPSDAIRAAQELNRIYLENTGITALISTRSRMLISIISWAAAMAKNIPGEISLLSLVHEPYLNHVTPPITSYRAPAEKTTRRLIRMIEALLAHRRISNSLILPELYPGHSISTPSCP